MKTPLRQRAAQRGATLIEVLVSLVILMVGLLGLVGIMVESQRSQLESYQRVQALMLVQDMVGRMTANKAAGACYVQAGTVGTGSGSAPALSACTAPASQTTRATADLAEWQDLLKGSSESASGGAAVGGILGARGCITRDAATGIYQVSVAWQGIAATYAPPAGITCGTGSYGGDTYRRAVSLTTLL